MVRPSAFFFCTARGKVVSLPATVMASHEKLNQIIASYPRIVICGHHLPDGDCYGCQIGLREILRLAYPEKEIYAVGTGVPALFARFAPMDEVPDEAFQNALVILVDVSCLRRAEDPRVFSSPCAIKFDHHEKNELSETFQGESFVDSQRVSCGEIICDFVRANNMPMNRLAAEALYMSIVTDSGHFRFDGVTQETFKTVAGLFRYGVEPKSIFDILFHETPEEKAYQKWMKENARCVGQVSYVYAKRSDYERFGLTYERAGGFANALLGLNHSNIFFYCCERDDDYVRVEIRSAKRYPVQETAKHFGGGGHRYASGMEIINGKPTLEEIIDALNAVTI